MTTVKQLIESLKRFDENMPVEIAISQANKRFPIAYVEPMRSTFLENEYFAVSRNGKDVRIEVMLPSNEESMMITSIRKTL